MGKPKKLCLKSQITGRECVPRRPVTKEGRKTAEKKYDAIPQHPLGGQKNTKIQGDREKS